MDFGEHKKRIEIFDRKLKINSVGFDQSCDAFKTCKNHMYSLLKSLAKPPFFSISIGIG